jgi:hypothetical protein
VFLFIYDVDVWYGTGGSLVFIVIKTCGTGTVRYNIIILWYRHRTVPYRTVRYRMLNYFIFGLYSTVPYGKVRYRYGTV